MLTERVRLPRVATRTWFDFPTSPRFSGTCGCFLFETSSRFVAGPLRAGDAKRLPELLEGPPRALVAPLALMAPFDFDRSVI